MRLVLASSNQKKLAELQALLAPAGVTLVTQQSLGIAEAEEPHATFIENAITKVRHAAMHAQGPAIADDSGLCVDALGGAPGVISAHFASVELPAADRETQRRFQDAANNHLLIARLRNEPDRRARFVSTLVAVGRWHGEILQEAVGTGGFGYDPLLFIPALGRAVAELSPELKNAHSHRALAARQMLLLMRDAWQLG